MRSLIVRIPYTLIAYPLAAGVWVVGPAMTIIGYGIGSKKVGSWAAKKIYGGLSMLISMASVEIEGLEYLEYDGSMVMTPNHSGILEYPLLYAYIPRSVHFIAKEGFRRIPFLGKAMEMAGNIFIARNKSDVAKLQSEEETIINEKKLVVAYPEGTRTRDPKQRIGPFKKGPFVLAIRTQSPVVPMVITGIADFLPADHWLMNPAPRIRMKILPPIPTRGMTYADREQLHDEVRGLMIEAHKQIGGAGGMPP